MKKQFYFIFFSVFISKSALAGPIENEIIILLDASGSVYDSTYSTWLAMLDTAEHIVSQTESSNTAHGIGIFSGSSAAHTVYSSAAQGRMNMHWGLSDTAIDPFTGDQINGSQDAGDVAGFVAGLDESDFLFGYSWHDEALEMALTSFLNSGNSANTNKSIVILTDGGSPTSGHEAVIPGGYASPTFQNLLSLDVSIATVVFETSSAVDTAYFNELVTDPSLFVSATDFGFNPNALVNTVAPSVPEPESTLLISMGLLGLLLAHKKRQNRLS